MGENTSKDYSRREFVTGVGGVGAGVVLGGALVKGLLFPDEVVAIPASDGYLVVDTDKCAGCDSCMIACSLAHEGNASLSNSRIQVIRDIYEDFPNDIVQQQCRQCPYPACVEACPTGANHADADNGNVRTIDAEKCIGCQRCMNACPFTPSRVLWNADERHAQKCDLCTGAAHWDGEDPACVTVCPMKAIRYVEEIPSQTGDSGYHVNLKTSKWGQEYWLYG